MEDYLLIKNFFTLKNIEEKIEKLFVDKKLLNSRRY